MSAPSSIRFTDDGIKALKSLEAVTGKTRVDLVSEALVEKHNRTVALAPIQLRILAPSEILTLQSEIASIEKLHNDKRRKIKIKTSDKDATEKIIKAVEAIDLELAELQALRLKIGKQAQLADSITDEDIKNIKLLIKWVEKRIVKAKAESSPDLAVLEAELKILTALFP